MFGPHVTNLGDHHRGFTPRHTAYYERRASGGCGVIVTEGASVHPGDWPYERAPLASACATGWAAIAAACHAHGATVIASLDHAGGQGSSAYNQRELWAPSRGARGERREVPKWMEADDIAAVVPGSPTPPPSPLPPGATAWRSTPASTAWCASSSAGSPTTVATSGATARCSPVRSSGLSGPPPVGPVVGPAAVVRRAGTVGRHHRPTWRPRSPPNWWPRASTTWWWCAVPSSPSRRPAADFHEPLGFNVEVCRAVPSAVPGTTVFLQGSLDAHTAEWALAEHVADAAEITRGQIADPDLVEKLATRLTDRIRPCIRCNQTCQVRDGRNPVVTCIGEPTPGGETDDPNWLAVRPALAMSSSWVAVWPAWRRPAWPPCAAISAHRRAARRPGGLAALLPHAKPLVGLARAPRSPGSGVDRPPRHRHDRTGPGRRVCAVHRFGGPGSGEYEVDDGAVVARRRRRRVAAR